MLRDLYEIYGSAEAYFTESILGTVGKQNTVSKKQLLEAVMQAGAAGQETPGRLRGLRKAELFERLVKARGPEAAVHTFAVGLTAAPFMRRFGVTRIELEKLAKQGVIRQTGEYRLRDRTVCKLFSIWDYFHLDPEEVRVAVERMRAGVQSEGIATSCGLAMTEGTDCRVAGAPRNDSGSGEPE